MPYIDSRYRGRSLGQINLSPRGFISFHFNECLPRMRSFMLYDCVANLEIFNMVYRPCHSQENCISNFFQQYLQRAALYFVRDLKRKRILSFRFGFLEIDHTILGTQNWVATFGSYVLITFLFSKLGLVAKSAPSLAASGGERPDRDEGLTFPDRVHSAESQAGSGVHAGDRSTLGAQVQEHQDQQHDTRKGPGRKKNC